MGKLRVIQGSGKKSSFTGYTSDCLYIDTSSTASSRGIWVGDGGDGIQVSNYYIHPTAGTEAIYTPSTTTTATTLLTRVSIDSSGHVKDTSAFNGTVGGTTTPIYFNAGVPTALGYTIAKSVPSNAVFTDTKVTQTITSANANYPLILAPSTQTSTTTGGAYFETAIKINPSTRTISGVDYISSDTTDLHIQCNEWLILDGGGDGCGIRPNSTNIDDCDLGTTSIRFRNAYFSNQVLAASGFYESSDERLKTFNKNLNVDLDALSKCRKSYFTFNDKPEQNQIGMSAQEIQKLYPEVVTETSDGYLNVDYAKLSVIALAAIDKLYEEIKELKEKIK